ncbi:hypothetical protein HZC31_06220 [Candidatus Woesearchaeota archaeon]|nr:hypothetical protein [Candidatus Woesearchaeota archaeon]
MDEIQPNSKRRNRQRSIAISDNLWNEIKSVTNSYMSVSQFIRMAIQKELQRTRKTSIFSKE